MTAAITSIRNLLLLAACCALMPMQAFGQVVDSQSPQPIKATVKRMNQDGDAYFEVSAGSFVHATPQRVWQVLTDYERLPEFVPGLQSSKILSRSGNEVLIEQQGVIGFLFLSAAVHLTVRVVEQPQSGIDVALVSGNMKRYGSHWEIASLKQDGIDGTRLQYTGRMEPNFFAPPLLSQVILEADVKKMMAAVVEEIGKEAAGK